MSTTLVAVSPQSVSHNRKLIEERKLDFEVLNDRHNAYADQLGLKHGFPADLKEVYGKFGINLDEYNENTDWELAIPARLVVKSDGVIRAVDFSTDYTVRPEPSETIEHLRNL